VTTREATIRELLAVEAALGPMDVSMSNGGPESEYETVVFSCEPRLRDELLHAAFVHAERGRWTVRSVRLIDCADGWALEMTIWPNWRPRLGA
jgi:hypothetical protein